MNARKNNHGVIRLRRLLKSPILIVILLVVGLAVGLTIFHYRAHLLWYFGAQRAKLQDVPPIPDHPMPGTLVPGDWIRCRVKCIEFHLPPKLAYSGVAHADVSEDGFLVRFQNENRGVVVNLLPEEHQSTDVLSAAETLSPEPRSFNMPRLRLALYRADSHDFSWSMTGAELQWHVFRLSTGRILRLIADGHVETYFTEPVDVLVQFGHTRAVADWQFNKTACAGSMLFTDEGDMDPEWIRAVCRSLKTSNPASTADSRALTFP